MCPRFSENSIYRLVAFLFGIWFCCLQYNINSGI
nr:MAG TPA: hypothetical protein [Caudoviricetes sp.]